MVLAGLWKKIIVKSGSVLQTIFIYFGGTPSGMWLAYEFSEILGIKEKLNSLNAQKIYDQIAEKLNSPEFQPRRLFEKFNIEVLSTTDAAGDFIGKSSGIKNHRGLEWTHYSGVSTGYGCQSFLFNLAKRY